MDYLALYRKYRPKELNEVVGQNEIKKILASSIKNGTFTHAYLFSGPRGTGKTTMAKILAKMVNCMDPVDGDACNKCDSCINILNSSDVIEIDAASNNGVDEIRDLREKANLVPASAKYKVYIIDEVHMLTTQAFNALLKTLEEPPKHVIFILATTEYYKIPLTISSRCQKFQFNKISNIDIVDRLRQISELEKIQVTDDALFEIAKISDGGMRDSINLLDQLRSFSADVISIDDVHEVCGNVSNTEIINFLRGIKENNFEEVTNFLEFIDSSGKNYGKFLEDLISFLKDAILLDRGVSYKYIKSEISSLKELNSLYSVDDIFYLISAIMEFIDSLKKTSRQSVMVVSKFLLIMNKLSSNSGLANIENTFASLSDSDFGTEKGNEYDPAFKFTSHADNQNVSLTDNLMLKPEVTTVFDNEELLKLIEKSKKSIVNNAFAVASKEIKSNLQELMKNLSNYLTDKKYKAVVASLVDVKIEVAGNGYIIFSVPSDAIAKKIYDNYQLCYEFLSLLFNGEYNFAALTVDEWLNWRNEYVINFKSGKKYELLAFDNLLLHDTKVKKDVTIVDKLFDIVGEENVEFK